MDTRESLTEKGNCPGEPKEQEVRRLVWGLVFGFALIYLAFLPPGIYSIDGNSILAVAESLVTQHSIAVPPGLGVVGPLPSTTIASSRALRVVAVWWWV